MTISAYLKNGILGAWVDLSDKVDHSSKPVITKRIDDAFESGSVKVWFNRSTTIPPYTPFLVNGRYMVGTSKVSRYLPESNVYIHDIRLLEATAFLKTIIIGTKVYSAESPTWGVDYAKFMSLVDLANVMYPDYTFVISPSHPLTGPYLSNLIKTSKTYLFGAKDTLYDCLNQLCLENNLKLKVNFDNSDPTTWNIELERVPKNTFYTLPTRIIGDIKDQNEEDYGRYLETYASNVVDRNTLTHAEWMFPTSDDIVLNADNAYIKLPTIAERIKEFGIHQAHVIQIKIAGLENYFSDCDTRFNNSISYDNLSMMYTMVGDQMVYIFDEIYDHYIAKYFPFVTKTAFYSTCYSLPYTLENELPIEVPISMNGKFPIATILEKSRWDNLTPQDQTGCLFYTTGSDKVENMNASYKDDLWSNITGITRHNFLNYSNESPHTSVTIVDNVEPLDIYMYSNISVNDNLFQYMYWCDYNAITNPLIRDDKEDDGDLILSSEFAPISRSYGNSDNFIDFDKLIPNMHISNQTLGRVERTLQLDLTDEVTYPEAGQKVTIGGSTLYISNVIIEYGVDIVTATLLLVVNYNKKADAIGVDSQSEFTNNPLKNITTRPIMINSTTTTAIEDVVKSTWYMRFKFYDHNNNSISNPDGNGGIVTYLIKRCSVQAAGDTVLFYCEMKDQMILDDARGTFTTDNYWEQLPFRYTGMDAEAGYVEISLGYLAATTYQLPILLPQGTNTTFTAVHVFQKIRIDKDAREKLTFSIRLNYTNVR